MIIRLLIAFATTMLLTAGGFFYVGGSGTPPVDETYEDLGTLQFMFDPRTSAAEKMTLNGARVVTYFDQAGSYDLAQSVNNRRPDWEAAVKNGNGAIKCDGSRGSSLNRPDTKLVRNDQPFTFFIASKLIQYEWSPARGAVFSIGADLTPPAADSWFFIHQDNNLFFGAGASSGFNYGVKSTTDAGDDTAWHSYVVTYDGSGPTDSSSYRYYVDGVQVTVTGADVTGWNSGESTLALCSYSDSTDNQNSFTGYVGRIGKYLEELDHTKSIYLGNNLLNPEWVN